MMSVSQHILWAATTLGYAVQIFDGDEMVEEYTAGNSPLCSQTYVSSGRGVGGPTMRKFARQTANEMAKEHDITAVAEDADLRSYLKEWLNA